MNRLPHFITQHNLSTGTYNGLGEFFFFFRVFFLEKTAFNLLAFCSLQHWLSLDTSGETTS